VSLLSGSSDPRIPSWKPIWRHYSVSKVRNCWQSGTASHPRRLETLAKYQQLWETQISASYPEAGYHLWGVWCLHVQSLNCSQVEAWSEPFETSVTIYQSPWRNIPVVLKSVYACVQAVHVTCKTFWCGNLKERDHLKDLGTDVRIILKCIWQNKVESSWTGLVWLWIGTGTSCMPLWTQ
jgi:hypothetical protein